MVSGMHRHDTNNINNSVSFRHALNLRKLITEGGQLCYCYTHEKLTNRGKLKLALLLGHEEDPLNPKLQPL